MSERNDDWPKVPEGVLKGIKDLLNRRTASKEDLDDALND